MAEPSADNDQRLRGLLANLRPVLSGENLDSLIAQAQAQAVAQVQSLLASALRDALIEDLRMHLQNAARPLPNPADHDDRPPAEPAAAATGAGDRGPRAAEIAAPGSSPPQTPQPTPMLTSLPASAANGDDAESAWYLYAVTFSQPAMADVIGGMTTEAHSLQRVRFGAIQAIAACLVPPAFDRQTAEGIDAETAWLQHQAVQHHRIVEALHEKGAVVPFRFGTALPDRDAVCRLLEKHEHQLTAQLQRLNETDEWGVKLLRDAASQGSCNRSNEADQPDPPTAAESGTAYLTRKQHRLRLQRQAQQQQQQLVQSCQAVLCSAAESVQVLPCQLPDGDSGCLLNATCLVPRSGRDAFHQQLATWVQQHQRQGVLLQTTGPWPPYSFVTLRIGDPN